MFGFDHLRQIFEKLFAKNMKGGSDQSEILCVGQLARAEKKSRKERVSQNPPLGGKYLPNIYLTYIIRKYLKSVLSAIFNWSSKFHSYPSCKLLELKLILLSILLLQWAVFN